MINSEISHFKQEDDSRNESQLKLPNNDTDEALDQYFEREDLALLTTHPNNNKKNWVQHEVNWKRV